MRDLNILPPKPVVFSLTVPTAYGTLVWSFDHVPSEGEVEMVIKKSQRFTVKG